MKKLLSVILVAVITLGIVFLTGCSPKGQSIDVKPKETTYKVAVSGSFPPFGFIGKDGKAQGFEIDVMEAIAEAEGIRFDYEVTSWSSKMPALKAKQVDVLMCSMTITDQRKKEVDFSDPYYESTNYLIVPEGSNITSLKDLKGKRVAVLLASTSDFVVSDFLGKNYEGIKRFKHTTTAFMELRNRNVDAAMGDSGIVMYYVKSNPEAKLKVIKDNSLPKEYYGMALRKGDKDLAGLINRGLQTIRNSGKYDELYQKWF